MEQLASRRESVTLADQLQVSLREAGRGTASWGLVSSQGGV